MSGIGGIYNLDGQVPDLAVLQQMMQRVRHRGPDGGGHWVSGNIALAHRMLHTTPESHAEKQPLCDETRGLYLTLDGRVDNREELWNELTSKGCTTRDQTDAELILKAYQCWGVDCPAKIIGDFAFALWDASNQQLLCARDFVGIKPFYYYSDSKLFLFGSELQQILAHPLVPVRPNKGMIAEYLAAVPSNLLETLYENIYQLPRAHRLIVRPGGVNLSCYYSVSDIDEIRYRSDEDYAQGFLTLFKDAVKCRLRSQNMVAADLSGGLDSSSVAVVAQSVLRENGVGTGLETFSVQFPGERYDESDYIHEVIRKGRLQANFVSEKPMKSYSFLARILQFRDFPTVPNSALFDRKMEVIREKQCRVVLNGLGGDDVLSGSFRHSADLVRRLRILKAFRHSRMDSMFLSHLGAPCSPASMFLRHALLPLLPPTARQLARAIRARNLDGRPAWINPQFARSANLADRQRNIGISTESCQTLAATDIREGLNFPLYWLIDRDFSRFSVEYRSPFLDRRLIRYCFALPHDQLRRGCEAKFVLRQAMKGLLPERVRTRLTKSRFGSHAYWDAIQAVGGGRLLDSLAIASQGWVNQGEVRRMYLTMQSQTNMESTHSSSYLFPLWMICGIELWFRTVFLDGSTVETARETNIQQGEL